MDELAYVAKLDERLLRVRQELVATAEVAKNLTMQLQTNATAQAVGRVSVLLGENTLHAAQWAREQSELHGLLPFQAGELRAGRESNFASPVLHFPILGSVTFVP
jgi:hypothetical protein